MDMFHSEVAYGKAWECQVNQDKGYISLKWV